MERGLKSNVLLRGALAVLLGLTLVIWKSMVFEWIVIFIGIITLIMGLVQFLGFLSQTKELDDRWSQLPISCLLAVLLGILLLVGSGPGANLLVFFMGVSMLFISIIQMLTLNKLKKSGVEIAGVYFIFPILLLLAGILVLFDKGAEWMVVFIGAWFIAYGVTEMFYYFGLKKPQQKIEE